MSDDATVKRLLDKWAGKSPATWRDAARAVEELTAALRGQADLSDAKVAAAYEAAARLIEDGNPDLWEYSTGNRARVVGTRDEGAEYIRALTPTDAQTALDAHVKRAVDEAVVAVWARCLAACDYEKELARECGPHHIPIINGIRDRIAAAIEGGRG